jgi:hypothetical protein
MILRLMTLATLLMLLACFMIGATIALAHSAKAVDLGEPPVSAAEETPAPSTAPFQQADPDSAKRPYQETLAEDEPVDQYNFDGLPGRADQDDNPALSYAAVSNC